uniref:TM2 domain containing 1 n=1 Tax=Callorhinchus milii TaxID=7868 RepID=A0A4W3JWU2_CALMI
MQIVFVQKLIIYEQMFWNIITTTINFVFHSVLMYGFLLALFPVACTPAPNITCKNYNGVVSTFSGKEVGFYKPISCRNVTNYSYKVAVALSLFLGWLGADRFYLGYPALGLLKFCTVGFCGIGSLIDFILISVQIVGPADGSSYIIDYYGARLIRLTINNDTYRKTQMDL